MWGYTKIVLFFLVLPNLVVGQKPIFPDYPSPRMVLVGPTGSGKSSLGNSLLGCDPRLDDCMFAVCPDMGSCTKDTKIGTGKWLGTGVNVTIVDTPGFGDTDNQDEEHIEEMMDIFANSLQHTDTFILVLKGNTGRFSEGLQTMLDRMTMMFGKSWWDFIVVGVSFWAYDQDSIDDRECFPDFPQYCKDEAWFSRNINTLTQERFGIERNFTFAFMDSWSQTEGPPGFNTDDPLQQAHWKNETGILWNETTSREETFKFMTINDFIEENARQKVEIKWLNDVITKNISKLNEGLHDVNQTVNEIQDVISEGVRSPPIGAIEAWISGSFLALPKGWMKCDGSKILEGPLAGNHTPAINGENGYFLRGGSAGMDFPGVFQEDQIKNHNLKVTDPGHSHSYQRSYNTDSVAHTHPHINAMRTYENDATSTAKTGVSVSYTAGGDETRPKSFSVEWIIRIK